MALGRNPPGVPGRDSSRLLARSHDVKSSAARYARGTRGLFHFASDRTHAGGLLGLGVNADPRHSAHSSAADGNHVATRPQVGLHFFGQRVGHRQAAQAGAALAEGADEMRGGEARRLKRLLGTHVEFHVVEDDLDGCLILLVAASYRYRHYGMVVMEK